MDNLLFSTRSLLTMLHGIVLGGGALIAVGAALFALIAMRATPDGAATDAQARYVGWLLVAAAALLWLAVIAGTYVSFPPYRATPPEGLTDLSQYPRALIRSDASTAWLHSIAMESKEHMPWIAAMLATGVAFTGMRYRGRLLSDARVRGPAISLLSICFVLVAAVSMLGILINKVAPLQ
ncbi:MAG TPA: hypothetical protein VFZ69_07400 [Longimicrobiales bacterium]